MPADTTWISYFYDIVMVFIICSKMLLVLNISYCSTCLWSDLVCVKWDVKWHFMLNVIYILHQTSIAAVNCSCIVTVLICADWCYRIPVYKSTEGIHLICWCSQGSTWNYSLWSTHSVILYSFTNSSSSFWGSPTHKLLPCWLNIRADVFIKLKSST